MACRCMARIWAGEDGEDVIVEEAMRLNPPGQPARIHLIKTEA